MSNKLQVRAHIVLMYVTFHGLRRTKKFYVNQSCMSRISVVRVWHGLWTKGVAKCALLIYVDFVLTRTTAFAPGCDQIEICNF